MRTIPFVFLFAVTSVWAGRPDAAFSFKDNTCVCRNEKPVSKGDCVNVCRGKNTKGIDFLYADFDVTSVLANSSLKNVKNWCYRVLIGDHANPHCVVEATDELGKKTFLNFTFPKDNSLASDVSTLADDMNYTFRLVEQTSNTASFPHDVYIFDPVGVPLKQSSLTQYSCYPKSTSDQRLHFFFTDPHNPSPVSGNFICHDTASYGPVDKPTTPRLDTIASVATLWNPQNFLFFDNNGDGVLDVNEYYLAKMKEYGGPSKNNVRLFGVLAAPGTQDNNFEAGNMNYKTLGFVMSYWVDNSTFTSYCPGETEFATNKPEFRAIKDIVGKPMEGIYVADRSENEIKDYLLVRESDIRSVWFWQKNGVATKPTEDILPFQQIFFYYPFNKTNPYVKGANQKIYRVRSTNEVGSLTTLQAFVGTTGEMINYPSHDKKIACVPKN